MTCWVAMTADAAQTGQPLTAAARGGLGVAVARWVLGATFVAMGSAKVGDTVTFLKLIREYGLVSEDNSTILTSLAVVLPWLELWLGALVLAGVAVRGSSLALLAMLVVFTGAIGLRTQGLMETEGLALCAVAFDCGCGSGVVNVCRKLSENLGLMTLAVVVLCSGNSRMCLRHRLLGAPGRAPATEDSGMFAAGVHE